MTGLAVRSSPEGRNEKAGGREVCTQPRAFPALPWDRAQNTYHSIIYPASPLPPNDFKTKNSAPARVGIKLHGETFHSSMTRLFPVSAMNEALLINC